MASFISSRWRWVVTAVALGGLVGCRGGGGESAPRQPPPLTLAVTAFVGSPLNPTTRPARVAGASAVLIDVTWVALGRVPPDALPPLDARSTLVTAPLAGGPVLVSGNQTRRAGFGEGEAADRLLARLHAGEAGAMARAGYQVGLVAPGTTARFRCDLGPQSAGRSVVLSFTRPEMAGATTSPAATSPSTTVPATNDAAASSVATTAGTTMATMNAPTSAAALQPATQPADGSLTVALRGLSDAGPATAETAFVDGLSLAPGSRLALIVPVNFGTGQSGDWTALAAYITVTDPPPGAASELADTIRRTASTRPDGPTTLPGERLSLQRAVLALRSGGDPRPPLLFLATATEATIAMDAVLVADGPTLDRLRDALHAFAKSAETTAGGSAATNAADPPPAEPPGESVGWFLDRTAVLTLAEAAGQGTLPPELAAVLVRHAGEVGRHPESLVEAVNAVGSRADLLSRLVGENYIALEDNAPAARVRAYDWLKAQGRAPGGFDPLADARARRAAINRALDASNGAAR